MSPEQTRITRLEAALGNLMKAYADCNGEDHQAYIDAEAILSTAAPTPQNLHAVAVSLSTMIYEWVDTGIKGGTDWKSGLALVIEKRLRRFPAISSQEQDASTLDARMKAAGMYTIAEMMGVTPLTKWMSNPAINTLEAFEEWLDRKTAEYLRMRMPYELGDKKDDDELHDWVVAHSAVFSSIRDQFRVVKAALGQDEAVAEIVSAHGDPEAFGERELVARIDIQKFPYGTKLYAAKHGDAA